ncbi:hypothetical protein [Microcoleus sp. F4-D5]
MEVGIDADSNNRDGKFSISVDWKLGSMRIATVAIAFLASDNTLNL